MFARLRALSGKVGPLRATPKAPLPAAHFQDAAHPPLTFEQIQQAPLGLAQLFSDPRTKRASWSLLASFLFVYGTLMYELYESELDLALTQRDTKETLKEQESAKANMAVHIGLLKRQLIDEGVTPLPSSQARYYSKLLTNNSGEKDASASRKSHLRNLIPVHSEYDPVSKD